MELNSNQIAEILPHHYPFALVDRIVDGESGKWAKGIKCVTVNEPFFQGHFPQYHVMPGVRHHQAERSRSRGRGEGHGKRRPGRVGGAHLRPGQGFLIALPSAFCYNTDEKDTVLRRRGHAGRKI